MVVRGALRLGFGTASLLAGGWVLGALRGTPASLGASPAEIAAVARRSPHFQDGAFVNIDPPSPAKLNAEERRMLMRELIGVHAVGRPPDPIPSQRCSPSRSVGPQRMHEVPLPLEALPAVDAVVISHDHYDHLDIDTIIGLARTQRAPFVVPLGVGAHLRRWGIPKSRVVELDWNESHQIGDLTLVCAPARHFSGRLFTRDTTLWASWVIVGPQHRAFFGGDTGYSKSFAQIGVDHGPFDVTLLPIGAYHPAWPDIHMNPEDAVRAHLDMAEADSGLLVPIHWATFRLAPHPWAEPVE